MSAGNRRESKGEKEEEKKEERERKVVEEEEGERRKDRAMNRKGTRENKWICDEVTFLPGA